MIVLTFGQADPDLDRAQRKSDLKDLAVRPTPERLTKSRDLWPNFFYLLRFFLKKYFNKSYILKNEILKHSAVFSISYICICLTGQRSESKGHS